MCVEEKKGSVTEPQNIKSGQKRSQWTRRSKRGSVRNLKKWEGKRVSMSNVKKNQSIKKKTKKSGFAEMSLLSH